MYCPRCHRRYPAGYRFCPIDGESTAERLDLDRLPATRTRFTDSTLGERYKVRGFIGAGKFARVYLAEDFDTGMPVAIKVLEEPYRSDEKGRARFMREAETVAAIGHPNIVEVFETGDREEDGAPYIVMEFLFGEPLSRFLDRQKTVPLDMAIAALRQAAAALHAAHDKGVVHRDVKPGNLFLVGEPGDPYELKVLDFGFSKLENSALTAAGVVLGTPAYMAPEQIVADALDARTDVYALGMVMYRMLTGAHAFDVTDDVSMLAHQLLVAPVLPSKRVADLDGRAEQVILTAIRKKPAHRYPSMAVFDDDLRKLADPSARLWAAPAPPDRYVPQTRLGEMVIESLARAIDFES